MNVRQAEMGIVVAPPVSEFEINQIKAGDAAFQEIQKQLEGLNIDAKFTEGLRETDVFRLRRGLCLPSAAAAAINRSEEKRVIGDDSGEWKISDFFRVMLPLHGQPTGDPSYPYYLVATSQGDVYHHAIVSFTKIFGLNATSLQGFTDLGQLYENAQGQGNASLVVSLDNRYVLDQTLGNNPRYVNRTGEKPQILVDGPNGREFRVFENGTHAVTIFDIHAGQALVADSFMLPQMNEPLTREVPVETLNTYLRYASGVPSRGILVSKATIEIDPRIAQTNANFEPSFVRSVIDGEKGKFVDKPS